MGIGGGVLEANRTPAVQAIETDIGNLKVLSFSSDSTPYDISNTNLIGNPIIFAKWQIDRGDTSDNELIVSNDPVMVCLGKRIAGTTNVSFGWFESTDGTTWSSRASNGFNGATFASRNTNTGEGFFSSSILYIALIAYVNGSDTNGQIKNISAQCQICLPANMTLTRLI